MARKTGDLIACLRETLHHVSHANTKAVAFHIMRDGVESQTLVTGRLDLIRDELQTAMTQLKRIKEVADKQGLSEILDILNEKVEFGHDF